MKTSRRGQKQRQQTAGPRFRRLGRATALVYLMYARGAAAGGAVEQVAQDVAKSLGKAPSSSVVIAAPLTSDQPSARGDELALRIAALVAGNIDAGARTHPQTAQLASARAIAGRASALVYVQSEIVRGSLRATADVYASVANGWDRIRKPVPAPSAHAFAAAKVDAEVRTFLVPLVLEQASLHRAHHDEGEVLAVACGDVNEDGGAELVLLSRSRVAIGRVREARFVPEHSVPWSILAPRAAVPMRAPLAGAVATAGKIAVGSTDRGSVSLTPDFESHVALSGVPVWGGEGPLCLLAEPSAGAFEGAPFDCTVSRDTRAKMAVPAPRFDAFAASSFVDPEGRGHTALAVREPNGKLRVRIDDQAAQAPDGTFGAQLAMGDLDQDGAPEIATTVDGVDDAVLVFTLSPALADLRPRLRFPAPGGVRALAMCPPEQGGRPVLVAVVGSEVWLVRAEAKTAGDAER